MNIGIITFHSAHNYGACLQAYALQTILDNNGYNVRIIDFKNDYIDRNFKPFVIRKGNIVRKIKSVAINVICCKKNVKRYLSFKKFINNYYQLTEKVTGDNLNDKLGREFDVIITGSDQVWNPNLAGGLLDAYTLNWGIKGTGRISYAASVGNIQIVKENIDEYINKLKCIDNISVRETDLKNMLALKLKRKIQVVLDPTLLLETKFWDSIAIAGPKEDYIFAYAIGNHRTHQKLVDYISNKINVSVVHVERRNKYRRVLKNCYNDGPCEFLGLIRDSEVVITTSFHATVFAILFHKQFWVVPPSDTGERIMELLKLVELTDRIITCERDFELFKLNKPIDYLSVDRKIEHSRLYSKKWLFDAVDNYNCDKKDVK